MEYVVDRFHRKIKTHPLERRGRAYYLEGEILI